MRQYVSICGHSAVGKKSLVKRLLLPEGQSIRERFGMAGELAAFGDANHPSFNPAPVEKMLSAQQDCVLHFWQFSTHPWIANLQLHFPSDRHRVILLWRPWHIHVQAFLEPGRVPSYRPDVEGLKWVWREKIIPLFRPVEQSGVEFELVDASTPNYDAIQWPKE
jgi:hypothetical protein